MRRSAPSVRPVTPRRSARPWIAALCMLLLALAHGQSGVPDLPFDDNPDPDQCGIPTPVGEGMHGTITGEWAGELLFQDVHLYGSHLRNEVKGTVPHGSEVDIRMYQNNPVLDYWYVRWEGPAGPVEGWIPAPFLRRDGA